jgi:hypothetical protein
MVNHKLGFGIQEETKNIIIKNIGSVEFFTINPHKLFLVKPPND